MKILKLGKKYKYNGTLNYLDLDAILADVDKIDSDSKIETYGVLANDEAIESIKNRIENQKVNMISKDDIIEFYYLEHNIDKGYTSLEEDEHELNIIKDIKIEQFKFINITKDLHFYTDSLNLSKLKEV